MNAAAVSEGELVAPLLRHLINVSLAGIGFLFTMVQAEYLDAAAQAPWFELSFVAFIGCVVFGFLGQFAVATHVAGELPAVKWLQGRPYRVLLYLSWACFGVGILCFVSVLHGSI